MANLSRISKIVPLFVLAAVLLPTSAVAATPQATLTITPDKHFANVTFSNLKDVAKVSYTLMYDTNNRTTGFEGGFKTAKSTTRATRKQIIGSCSTKRCVYHQKPKNFTLNVTFTLRSGGVTRVSKSL